MKRYLSRVTVFLLAVLVGIAVSLVFYANVKRARSTSSSEIQVLVDSRVSALAAIGVPATAAAITARTPLYADYGASPPVRAEIAARAGVSLASLSVTANTTETSFAAGGTQSSSYNSAPRPTATANAITLDATDALPIITVQASSQGSRNASTLLGATVSSLQAAVLKLDRTEHVRAFDRMTLRPLGRPVNVTVTGKKPVKRPLIAGVGAFAALLIVGSGLDWLLVGRRRRRRFPSTVSSAGFAETPDGSSEQTNTSEERLATRSGNADDPQRID